MFSKQTCRYFPTPLPCLDPQSKVPPSFSKWTLLQQILSVRSAGYNVSSLYMLTDISYSTRHRSRCQLKKRLHNSTVFHVT